MPRSARATSPRQGAAATGRRRSAGKRPATRNPARTRERILKAAQAQFCRHGYNGARIQQIATRAQTNIRMVYHYFGSKEKLYITVLEGIYKKVRRSEAALDLEHLEPVQAMSKLVDFTFTHLIENPDFVSLVTNENLLRGRYVRKSKLIPEMTLPLMDAIHDVLRRGEKAKVFHHKVDPIQLYVTILSLCYVHLCNKYTLSNMFQKDFSDPQWLKARRAHAQDVILSFLEHPSIARRAK